MGSNQVNSYEKLMEEITPNGCPACSENGECVEEECQCYVGWYLADCSMSEDEYDQIIENKLNILEKIKDNFPDDPDADTITATLNALK
mmetsp:Transcript_18907/g.16325  ORF Transcript_18907/g.16325 Transcript_18907/m.16325 type:complete len:89 (+) Transcript_18907:136-402(+)